jgi:hypothetical protein
LQGNGTVAFGLGFGAGLRCVGGTLKRLYTHTASGGVVSAPVGSDLPVHMRAAALGDTILAGHTRYYMAYYRDPIPPGGCSLATSSFNGTQAGAVIWLP